MQHWKGGDHGLYGGFSVVGIFDMVQDATRVTRKLRDDFKKEEIESQGF